LDTSIYIYYFEDNGLFADKVDGLFEKLIGSKTSILASVLLKTELLVKPMREKNKELIDKYSDLISYLPGLKFVDVSSEVAIKAARLRAEFGVGMADALHLASAIVGGAKTFVTADRKLKRVGGIEVVVL